MSAPNNDVRKSNNDKNNNNHLKFAILAATLAVGILAAALTAGQAVNSALAQSDINKNTTTTINTNANSGDILPPHPYPGYYQAPSTVSTTGTATTKVKPDKFSITLGVETNGTTAEEAASANAGLMAKVLGALKDLGISDDSISTSYYNVYPVYDSGYPTKPCIDIYPSPPECQPKQVITGYRASNTVTITLDVSDNIDAGKVIDTAVRAGATNVNGVYFFVSEDVQGQIRDSLIKQAIENARHRADTAASALGLTVSGVQSISLNDVYFPYYAKSLDTGVRESAAGAPTQIMPGEQDVSTTVSAVFYFSNTLMGSSPENQTATPSGMTASQNNPNCVNPPNGPMIC
jgi:uncharacterized protein